MPDSDPMADPDPIFGMDPTDHLPLALLPSDLIALAPTRSSPPGSTIDVLPNMSGYSWVAYAASSILVISHFPSPDETLIGPIFCQLLQLSSSAIAAVSWSPVSPSNGNLVAAVDNCIRLFQHDSATSKAADVFLWRNKKISAGVLGGATAMWVLFELLEYHLLTLVCHILVLSLAVLFLWSNASTFINKSRPHIPEFHIPEEPVLQVAAALRIEINNAFGFLRDIASGRDLKKFLSAIAGLWVLSIVGNWCNFLTLFYIAFVLLHTLPVLYEKYEDQVDSFAEKAHAEFNKQYAVFDAKVLSKIPRGPLKDKKRD